MASFVVFEDPAAPADIGVAYVRDGFHWFAFLVAPVWLLWHRLWIEALAALALSLGIGTLAGWFEWQWAGTLASLLVSFVIGLEAPALHMWALRRRGWREWGVVEALNEAEAAIRHVTEAFRDEPPLSTAQAPVPRMAPRPAEGPALGLFSYPGGR